VLAAHPDTAERRELGRGVSVGSVRRDYETAEPSGCGRCTRADQRSSSVAD